MDKAHDYDVVVIGSGMGGISTACLLAKQGKKVAILEANYLPGGCTSSYWRKGFVFEAGATTLVGLDAHQPLRYLLDELGIEIPARNLPIPMQVVLKDGTKFTRFQNLEQWIDEAEMVFGEEGQRAFWEYCFEVSQWVWKTSTRQRRFPFDSIKDLLFAITKIQGNEWKYAHLIGMSTYSLLKKYGLHTNKTFVDFVNEQLVITAQNQATEVNALFGAASLCYTNYNNYYVDGGLLQLVQPLLDYFAAIGGELILREPVQAVVRKEGHYEITGTKANYRAKQVVFNLPINNVLKLYEGLAQLKPKLVNHVLPSEELSSALQLGIAFRTEKRWDVLHHQIHLPESMKETGAKSIFLSLSHPDDSLRSDEAGFTVANVSTHLYNPDKQRHINKQEAVDMVLEVLEARSYIKKDSIVYLHCSDASDWLKWTRREWGFVGGYPQKLSRYPWQMLGHVLDGKGAFICGDTTYPGQGIPGVVLSGIITAEKMK